MKTSSTKAFESKFPGFKVQTYVMNDDKTLRRIFRSFVGCNSMGIELANNEGRRILMLTAGTPQRGKPGCDVWASDAEPALPRAPAHPNIVAPPPDDPAPGKGLDGDGARAYISIL